MDTLFKLLRGTQVKAYANFSTTPALKPELNENLSSAEGFLVDGKKAVVAVHMKNQGDANIFVDWNGTGDTIHLGLASSTMKATFKGLNEDWTVKRVDLFGNETPLHWSQGSNGDMQVTVPILDTNPDVRAVNTNGNETIFYIVAEGPAIAEPPAAVDDKPALTTAAISPSAPDGQNGWYVHPVEIALNATDDGAGVAKTDYSLDGGSTWESYADPLKFDHDGKYNVAFRSTDQAGNVESVKTVSVNVDMSAPALTAVLDKTVLWPPNHKMITVNANVQAEDGLSGLDSVILTSVTSSEHDAGLGNEDLPNDIQGAEIGTSDSRFQLRAERMGNSRVYTVTYTAVDRAGNQTRGSASVTVPHSASGN